MGLIVCTRMCKCVKVFFICGVYEFISFGSDGNCVCVVFLCVHVPLRLMLAHVHVADENAQPLGVDFLCVCELACPYVCVCLSN